LSIYFDSSGKRFPEGKIVCHSLVERVGNPPCPVKLRLSLLQKMLTLLIDLWYLNSVRTWGGGDCFAVHPPQTGGNQTVSRMKKVVSAG